jgi:hypothetical protein
MPNLATTGGIGLKRLQHLVLWVSDVEQSVRFYRAHRGIAMPAGARS